MPVSVLTAVLVAFLASLGLDWPDFPFNARAADVLFLLLVVGLAARSWSWPRWTILDWLVVAYLAGGLPSFAATTDVRASAIELVRQGYLVAVYVAIAVTVRRGQTRAIVAGLALSGATLAIAGLAFVGVSAVRPFTLPAGGEVMSLPYLGAVLRLRAFTASEAMLACVFTMAAPFAVVLAASTDDRRTRVAWGAAAAMMVFAAPFTFSHSIAGLGVALALVTRPLLKTHPHWRRITSIGAVALVLAFNLAATVSIRAITVGARGVVDATNYHYAVDTGQLTLGPMTVDYNVMSYLRLKEVAWETFARQPLTGVGLDRFHEASERAFQQGRLTASYRVIDPHSTLLGRLAEAGLVGGLTLVIMWVGFGATAARLGRGDSDDSWIAWAAVAGCAGLLVNSANIDIMNFRFVWVGLGLVRGLTKQTTLTLR